MGTLAMAALDESETGLSFAVRLQDDFSREWSLVDRTRVFLKGSGLLARENPSRYYVFTDLEGTAFAMRVENRCYHDREEDVDTATLDVRHPVLPFVMKPHWLYPFPASSTLIRGTVVGSGGDPVGDARVEVVGSTVENRTGEDGRFVLYFTPLTEDDVEIVGTRRDVKVGASTTLQLRIVHPSYAEQTVTIGTLEEGTTKLLTAPLVLAP